MANFYLDTPELKHHLSHPLMKRIVELKERNYADKDNFDYAPIDFEDAMDSYEAFMDEYVAFMKKYSDNPSDVGLLADYTKYMSKYADMVEKFDKWESEDLNDAELAYYIDVQARVSKKLLDVAG